MLPSFFRFRALSSMPPQPLLRVLPYLAILTALTACSGTPDVVSMLSPHRIDVRQGNYVSQEMVARLRPGMTRDQVRFVLGTPLVADLFNADQWDYVYRFRSGQGDVQTRRLVVFFEDGKLVRVGGDVVAATGDAPAEAPAQAARIIEVPGQAKRE